MANPIGRPPKYKTPEDMQIAIDKYFNDCIKNNEPFTVCGMALALDFMDRRSFFDYIENKSEFTHTIKKAKSRIEKYLEEQLSGGRQVAGLIFNLKNNFGWVDKQEIDTKITGELSLTDILGHKKE